VSKIVRNNEEKKKDRCYQMIIWQNDGISKVISQHTDTDDSQMLQILQKRNDYVGKYNYIQ
jgi:hypothetical protein